MDHFLEIIRTLSEYGFTPVNLILGTMLYFIGAKSGIFPRFWKQAEVEEEDPAQDAPVWARHLLQHFNHDTTDHHEATHAKLDEVRDRVKNVEVTLQNFDKYGVKLRQ